MARPHSLFMRTGFGLWRGCRCPVLCRPRFRPSSCRRREDAVREQMHRKVIWNLGFRGQGDTPFWENDPQYDTPQKRGALISRIMEEQRRREREAAERRLYESRRNMWDAEKRLKSAEKALAHEDEREEQVKLVRLQEREDKAARRAGGRVKYGADVDKQYE